MGRFWDKINPFKKPWEKVPCTFVLQGYGVHGDRGWVSVTEPSGKIISKKEAMEIMRKYPGTHFQLISRGIEDGQWKGIVWRHFEVPPGGVKEKEVKRKEKVEKETVERAPTPAEVMEAYASQLSEDLKPLAMLGEVMRSIRESFFSEGSSSTGSQMPPLEFEGKAPWVMHPYIVDHTAKAVKEVMDHAFDRVQETFGEKKAVGEVPEISLPKPSDYLKKVSRKPPPAPPTPPSEFKPPKPKPTEPPAPTPTQPKEPVKKEAPLKVEPAPPPEEPPKKVAKKTKKKVAKKKVKKVE